MNTKERKSIISHAWDMENGIITFTVRDAGQCKLDLNTTLEETRQTALYHGFTQKVQDKAAISRNPDTGGSASPKDKLAAMASLCEHLSGGGAWEMRAAAKASLNRAALFEALAEVTGRPADVISIKFADRPDEVLRTFLERKDIAAAYAARTAKDSGRADELLAELE